MSVECFSDPRSSLLQFLGTAPESCNWCGQPLVDPVVFWHLWDCKLSLHYQCAADLGGTLIFEAKRAEFISRGQSLLAGIDHCSRPTAGEPK
jgi:hypothetical protein